MKRGVSLLPAARLEVIEAHDWYEARAPGLGAVFQGEVDRQMTRLVERPESFLFILDDIRRAGLRRFPYGLFFRIDGDDIVVIACFHASRDPQIWKHRV